MSLTNHQENINAKRVQLEKLFEINDIVKKIILEIKQKGDRALAFYSQEFDNFTIDENQANPFKVTNDVKFTDLDKELQQALLISKNRIEKFHQHDLKNSIKDSWIFTGQHQEKLGAQLNAIESVALYIPGGNAPLVSTLLMTAIPAITAGVKRIALFSPPLINQNILGLADLLGITEIYQIGGAQAVAAAALGTESIQAFDKIVGPGNIFVSEAKKILNGIIGIDGIYGPSELAILCDETANIENLAIDLLSQLEHGSGLESTLLVSSSKDIIEKIEKQLEIEIEAINYTDKQKVTIKNSIKQWSAFIYEEDFNKAIELINNYAPEHLELQLSAEKIDQAKEQIKNAGAMFIGSKSCESLGDYLAGPSHCLPTANSARFSSGLQVSDFYKKTSIIDFSNAKEIEDLLEATAKIARAEGLEAHAKAADYRKTN
jgi:histidinol dehydrogenase